MPLPLDDLSDPAKPSTWKRFRPSLCERCFAGCCTLPVEVTPEDLFRMDLIDEDERSGSLKKAAKRLIKDGVVRYFRAGERLFTLDQKANDDCRYLDENRKCQIYDKRPKVCRSFPEVGPRSGFCPAKTFKP